MNDTDEGEARPLHPLHELHRLSAVGPAIPADRRSVDRRRRLWWSLLYGGFRPRRRGARRQGEDARSLAHDWHESHLLLVAIAILLLCAGDAFLTLRLLSAGAREVNPVMALVVDGDVALFTVCKTAMTGVGVVLLVAVARYRFMRRIRVEFALYAVLCAYFALVAYECWLLQRLGIAGFF